MKVRAGSIYLYDPVLMDVADPPYGHPERGELLKVVNLHGCPKANTMNHCHVNFARTSRTPKGRHRKAGDFAGLVCCNSLKSRNPVASKEG